MQRLRLFAPWVLVCLVLVVSARPADLTDAQRQAFRAARTVRVVSEVSAAKPENLLQPPELRPGEKTFVQPFEEATAAVLEKVGVTVVKGNGDPADVVLHVQATVETRANSFAIGRSGDRIVAFQYQGLGARWKGTVTATAPNVPPYRLSFEGDTVTPNPDKAITIMINDPRAAELDFSVSAGHAAAMALFAVGSYPSAVMDLLGQTYGREPLLAVLRDTQKAEWWRGTAASTLGWLGGEGTADLLLEMLNDHSPEVRAGVADGLGRLGDRRAVEPLLKALQDTHPAVQARAAGALGRLGDPRAIEPLVETTLKNARDEVSVRAAEALARLGDPSAVEALAAALQDKNGETRRRAVRALGKLGGPQPFEPLAAAAKDESSAVREEAVEALGKLENPRSTEVLMGALRDSDRGVRSAAATALGKMGDARGAEPLMAALADSDASVRRSVVKALGELGDRRAGPPLLPLLRDKDGAMRQVAAESLGKVGDVTCVESLIAALKDKEAPVRSAVAGALGQLTGQSFGENRKQWEQWWKQNKKTLLPKK